MGIPSTLTGPLEIPEIPSSHSLPRICWTCLWRDWSWETNQTGSKQQGMSSQPSRTKQICWKIGRFCRKIRHLRRSIMQALQPCSDTHCECEKRFTSPVSSCNQHTLQAAPHVKSTKQTWSQVENWPLLSQNQTSKEVHHAGIAALLGHPLRMWETVYVSSLIL